MKNYWFASFIFALCIILLAFIYGCGSNATGGGGGGSIPTVSTWEFVDGNGVNGINKDATKNAYYPQLTVFGSKLYATWSEYNGTVYQIRAAVFNGNDSTPTWTFVDGANGINKDATKNAGLPQLTVFGSKLYAAWYELNGTGIYQIRAAVFNGNDSTPTWTFVDGNGANGINKDATKNADNPQLTVLGSKLYAAWYENNGTADQIRAAVFNGNDSSPTWEFLDGNGTNGLNKDATKAALWPQLTVFGSKLYATWYENNGTADQIRAAVFNGNDLSPTWEFVDGNGANGLNKDATKNTNYPQLTVFGSKLYAIWSEDNGTAYQIRVVAGR